MYTLGGEGKLENVEYLISRSVNSNSFWSTYMIDYGKIDELKNENYSGYVVTNNQ